MRGFQVEPDLLRLEIAWISDHLAHEKTGRRARSAASVGWCIKSPEKRRNWLVPELDK